MPSRNPIQRFEDIVENIARIEEFTAGMDSTAFIGDRKTYDAVERCLERISEAARKLGSVAEELCPEVPWPKIRAIGNLLRHEYDRIDAIRLWFMVERDLAIVKSSVTATLERLKGSGD